MLATLYIGIIFLGLVAYYKTSWKGEQILIYTSLTLLGIYNYQAGLAVIGMTLATYSLQTNKKGAWLGIIGFLSTLVVSNYFLPKGLLFKLGLSYYSLQNIGVLLQTVRSKPQSYSFQQLLIANVFFPKYISGPILLPKEIGQIQANKTLQPSNLYWGLNRIILGLLKKLVIADNLTTITNTVFQHPEAEFKGITIVLATLLFTLEMYLNFSAYTDIALGGARLFNIKLKENFNIPMRSKSVTEYWRKTHISLIEWLTQNIFYYITYTFRKHPISSTIIGIFITFTLSGIWHGAALGFILWGVLNAVYLIIEYLGKRAGITFKGGLKYFGWALTLVFISFSNLFFRAEYLGNSKVYLQQIFNSENWSFEWGSDVIAILGNGGYLEQQFHLTIVAVLLILFFLLERKLEAIAKRGEISISFWVVTILMIFIFGSFNAGTEFIYMQF